MRPVPRRADGDDWRAFVETIGDLRAGRSGWPAELERARLWYEPHLDRIHEDASCAVLIDPARTDCVRLSLRERFLTELTLDHRMPRAIRLAYRYSMKTI